jgi:hypothetical protein
VLVAVAVVRIAADPEIRDCAGALAAAKPANSAYQDAIERLDRAELRARVGHGPPDAVLQVRVDETKREVLVARDAVARFCHFQR